MTKAKRKSLLPSRIPLPPLGVAKRRCMLLLGIPLLLWYVNSFVYDSLPALVQYEAVQGKVHSEDEPPTSVVPLPSDVVAQDGETQPKQDHGQGHSEDEPPASVVPLPSDVVPQDGETPPNQDDSESITPASFLASVQLDAVAPSSELPSQLASTPCAVQLSRQCTNEEAPMFLTFMVNVGRWKDIHMARSLRYMYSSLVRSHGCSPILHVHTALKPAQARAYYLGDATTTLGTPMHYIIFSTFDEDFLDNTYSRPEVVEKYGMWLALSRAKLDVYEITGKGAARPPVWIDLDTFVVSSDATNIIDQSFVIGHMTGKLNIEDDSHTFVQGDLWMLDQETLREFRVIEKETLKELEQGERSKLPKWDVQSTLEIMLQQDRGHLKTIQSLRPAYVYGFACAGFVKPLPEFLAKLGTWDESSSQQGLMCKNHLGEPSMVGSISFHAASYKKVFLNTTEDPKFEFLENAPARQWVNDFFYDNDNCEIPGVVHSTPRSGGYVPLHDDEDSLSSIDSVDVPVHVILGFGALFTFVCVAATRKIFWNWGRKKFMAKGKVSFEREPAARRESEKLLVI